MIDKKSKLQELLNPFFIKIGEVFSFKTDLKQEEVEKDIKSDISFYGFRAWILACSIIIASVGLNQNSTAVIIGAMLISPLMGPIVGLGLSLATQDIKTLVISLRNIAIAVIISIVSSALYFFISPIKSEVPELLSRTEPNLLDVFVAIFGGLAGIICQFRKNKGGSVIPGVAIATALMPPLCTAGYGLANFKLKFFLGAFYLFSINSVFIALSSYLFIRYFSNFKRTIIDDKSPLLKYKKYMVYVLIVMIIPSIIIFLNLIRKNRFLNQIDSFIEEKTYFFDSEIVNKKILYNDTLTEIKLYFVGKDINEKQIKKLNDDLVKHKISGKEFFTPTKKTIVTVINQGADIDRIETKIKNSNEKFKLDLLKEAFNKSSDIIEKKDKKIEELKKKIISLDSISHFPLLQIYKELITVFDLKEIKLNYSKKIIKGIEEKEKEMIIIFNDSTNKIEKTKKINNFISIRYPNYKVNIKSN